MLTAFSVFMIASLIWILCFLLFMRIQRYGRKPAFLFLFISTLTVLAGFYIAVNPPEFFYRNMYKRDFQFSIPDSASMLSHEISEPDVGGSYSSAVLIDVSECRDVIFSEFDFLPPDENNIIRTELLERFRKEHPEFEFSFLHLQADGSREYSYLFFDQKRSLLLYYHVTK